MRNFARQKEEIASLTAKAVSEESAPKVKEEIPTKKESAYTYDGKRVKEEDTDEENEFTGGVAIGSAKENEDADSDDQSRFSYNFNQGEMQDLSTSNNNPIQETCLVTPDNKAGQRRMQES